MHARLHCPLTSFSGEVLQIYLIWYIYYPICFQSIENCYAEVSNLKVRLLPTILRYVHQNCKIQIVLNVIFSHVYFRSAYRSFTGTRRKN